LKIQRQFFHLQTPTMSSDGKMHFLTEKAPQTSFKAGETVLMRVYVDSPTALPYVSMEVPLPSGAEVALKDPKLNLVDNQSTDDSNLVLDDCGSWWWTHQDVLDDRMVFFCTSLPQGKTEFHALVRLEMPGIFQINPASLEGMYSKSIQAYSKVESLTVSP
jgi:uncharacterized protein YfaS (alpha-2-macroglobulin family)